MAKTQFTFDGAISEDLPYIEPEAFKDLPKGTLLSGRIAYVEKYKGKVKAAVLINGHTTRITLWDMHLNEARTMIGDPITLKFDKMNDAGYPVCYARW